MKSVETYKAAFWQLSWSSRPTAFVLATVLLDEDEVLTVIRMPISEALSKTTNGEIRNAKTMVGLMLTGKRFGVDF